MRRLISAFGLCIALLSGVVGAGAHQQEGSCPMSNLPDCCMKARSAKQTAEVSMARLCCNLNCSEPGSTGSSMSSSFSPQSVDVPACAIISQGSPLDRIAHVGQFSPSPHTSNPKYLQHLALLI
jgi:hypothetical protein